MDKYLEKKPIITKADIKILKGCSDAYAYTFLKRLQKKNTVDQIIKGVYTSSKNIYAIATNIHVPSYLSLLAASYYKGYTEQIIQKIQVITTKKFNSINYQNYSLEYYQLKAFFGYKKEEDVFIAEDEKLLIDSLMMQERMGNFDEILKVVKNVEIDKKKLIAYLNRIGNSSLIKRVGFLLESYRGIILPFEIHDLNYVQLSFFKKGSTMNKKWRVKV